MTVAEVVQAYGSAWNEADQAVRLTLLDASWADAAVYCDPTGRAEGRRGLSEHISDFQQAMPGHRIAIVTSVDEHDGYVRFGWEMRDPTGMVTLRGVDFGSIAPDGRLERIVGFFGPLTASETERSPQVS